MRFERRYTEGQYKSRLMKVFFFKFTIFCLFEQGSCPTAYEKVKKIMASFQYFFCIWFCQYWWSKLFSHFYDLWWKLLYKWFSWVEKKCTFLFTFRVFRGLVTNQRELLWEKSMVLLKTNQYTYMIKKKPWLSCITSIWSLNSSQRRALEVRFWTETRTFYGRNGIIDS